MTKFNIRSLTNRLRAYKKHAGFKTLIIGKIGAVTSVLVLACAVMFLLFSTPATVGAAAVQRKLPVYCVKSEEKRASLTFDAAWGNEDTQQLIDILGKYGVRATFFIVGDWAEKYPESVKALSDAGHEVMNHSNKHKHMPQLSREDIISDLSACNKKIEKITGVSPTLFRAPYGEYDDKVITTVESIGMTTVQWDVDSLDWKELSAEEITERVLSRVSPGSIVLFHNAAKHTPAALPSIIEKLQSDGYTLVSAGELLIDGEYTLDHEGRQIPKT